MTTFQYQPNQVYRDQHSGLWIIEKVDNEGLARANRIGEGEPSLLWFDGHGKSRSLNRRIELTTLVSHPVKEPAPSPNYDMCAYDVRAFEDLCLGQRFRFAELGAPKPGLYQKIHIEPPFHERAWCAKIDVNYHHKNPIHETYHDRHVIPCDDEGNPKRKQRREWWVNLYCEHANCRASQVCTIYPSREQADRRAAKDRTACVHVRDEGDGLKGDQ